MFDIFGLRAIVKTQQALIDLLKIQLRHEQDRCNRLIESIKNGTPITMPYAPSPDQQLIERALEPSSGWWDNKRPVPPVEVKKVNKEKS